MSNEMFENAALKRQLVWDLVSHNQIPNPTVQEFFDLSPASEDVLHLEHMASHDRMDRIISVYPRIKLVSALASQIVARGILNSHGDVSESYLHLLDCAALACSVAVVADLVDIGLLVYPSPEG